jgi:pimeloyl-ACP methyl ester carboxylesterase
MGGWLSMEIAVRSLARIKSLTLISSVGIHIENNPVANLFIMPREQLVRAIYANPKIVAAELARDVSPEEVALVLTNRIASTHLAWRERRFCNPSLAKWLHRITVPTQILWGAEDGIVSAAYAAEFKRLLPHAEVTVWPGVGHVPFAEKLDEVVKTVGDFIMRSR